MPIRNYTRNISGLTYLLEALKIETDECQLWPFKKNKLGYGFVFVDGKEMRVHRHAQRLTKPDFDESLNSLHRCDNPPCFNPRHLFQGTQTENMADMDRKGRRDKTTKATGPQPPRPSIQGEKNAHAKITDEIVREIRRRYATGMYSQQRIADDFGINQTNVGFIVRRISWKHVK